MKNWSLQSTTYGQEESPGVETSLTIWKAKLLNRTLHENYANFGLCKSHTGMCIDVIVVILVLVSV